MECLVTVSGGTLRGFVRGALLHVRGVPYANATRFGEPTQVAPWQGVRDATAHGPICPQPESMMDQVMGKLAHTAEQAEDCLRLAITAPSRPGGPRAVMVWLHGGAYIVGAGSHAWYEADALAEEGDVIVVRVNYRLGALGFLHLPGVSPPNLGLLDQRAALQWIAQNIGAFGGDPARITVFGESAGAHSIAALMCAPSARALFQRAILQSPHLGVGFTSAARAKRVSRRFVRALRGEDPRTCSVERLVAAQRETMIAMAGVGGLDSTPCFGPIGELTPLDGATDLLRDPSRRRPDLSLIIGTTREELRSLFEVNPQLQRLRQSGALGTRLFNGIAALVTKKIFSEPAKQFADHQAEAGANVFTYTFVWSAPGGHLGACHTIDLAFVLGDEAAWRDAPMLGGAFADTRAVAASMRAAWTNFAREGDPNPAGATSWPRHRVGAEPGRRFG